MCPVLPDNLGRHRSLGASDYEPRGDSVALVGVSTNNSVEASARTAGNLGFETYVVADATFAFSKADYNGFMRSGDDVHAMALANLQGEYATVITAIELRELL